jgi:hypothetical protein
MTAELHHLPLDADAKRRQQQRRWANDWRRRKRKRIALVKVHADLRGLRMLARMGYLDPEAIEAGDSVAINAGMQRAWDALVNALYADFVD